MSIANTVSATAVVTAALHLYHKHTLDSCHPQVLKFKTSQVLHFSSPPKQHLFALIDCPVPHSPTAWTASTTLAGMQLTTRAAACTGLGPFPSPAPTVLPVVRFGLPKPPGHGHLHNADRDIVHHQHRLSLLHRNPGPDRKNPTQILQALCGRFHVVILQEAGDHATLVSDQFVAYTGGTDLAILLNKNTFEPDAAVAVINESSTSKDTWRDGCTGCSWTVSPPISLGHSYGHILLCPHSQCRGQKSETPRPLHFKPCMRTCCSTMST